MAIGIQKTFYDEKLVVDDLRFWVWAFDQFVGDVRDLLTDPHNLPRQMSLDEVARRLEDEFDLDAEHQRYWWMYYDRAAEAIPLLESDGPEHPKFPVGGFSTHIDYDKIRQNRNEDAYINLVGSNIDRKMGDLAGIKPHFYSEPVHTQHSEAIRALNHWVKDIGDNTNLDHKFNRHKYETISIGSGVMKFGHGTNWNSSDLAMFKNYVKRRDFLTPKELQRFDDTFEYHQFEFIPSFHCIRYRGAQGAEAASFSHPSHRQVHTFEHISVSQAKARYPRIADKIRPMIHEKALEMSPHLSLHHDEPRDMVTVFHHQVRFPVRETITVPVMGPNRNIFYAEREQPRWAIGSIDVVYGAGVAEMTLDPYDHNNFDLVQTVNFPSSKHSCGIGYVKFGRDPAIVHNQLHNGAIRWFGRSMKGGGFYVKGIVEDDDLKDTSKGNRWIGVDFSKIKPHLNRRDDVKLSDFIVDMRPPTFPTAWAQLMGLEEQALDRAMRSSPAWRGERTGYSGLQQSLAGQEAGMMHSNTHDIMRYSIKEMSELVFNNVVQFDGDRPITFTRKNKHGELEQFEMNQPQLPISQYDEQTGMYKTVASYIKNHIGNIQFITRIEPESIVPDRPLERVQWFIQMLQFLHPYLESITGRITLRGFQNEGFHIPSLASSLDQIEEVKKQEMELQGQLEEIAREYQQLLDDRDWAKDKAEINQNLLRLMQKFVSDLARANPDTIQTILNGRYPQVQGNFMDAMNQLLQGQASQGQLPSMPNINMGSGLPGPANGGGQAGGANKIMQMLQRQQQGQT